MAHILPFLRDSKVFKTLFKSAMEVGDICSAVKYLKEDMRIWQTPASRVNLAQLYTLLGRSDIANTILFEIIATEKNPEVMYLILAGNFSLLGNTELASYYMEKSCDSLIKSDAVFKITVEEDDKKLLLEDVKNMKLFKQFKVIDKKKEREERVLEEYYQLRTDKKYKKALDLLKKQKNDDKYCYELGLIYFYLEDCPSAEFHLQKAMQQPDQRISAIHWLIEIGVLEFNAQKAAHYTQVLIQEPIPSLNSVAGVLCRRLLAHNCNERVIEIAKSFLAKTEYDYDFAKLISIAYFNMGKKENSIYYIKKMCRIYSPYTDCDVLLEYFCDTENNAYETLRFSAENDFPLSIEARYNAEVQGFLESDLRTKRSMLRNDTTLGRKLQWYLVNSTEPEFAKALVELWNIESTEAITFLKKQLLLLNTYTRRKGLFLLQTMLSSCDDKRYFVVVNDIIRKLSFGASKRIEGCNNVNLQFAFSLCAAYICIEHPEKEEAIYKCFEKMYNVFAADTKLANKFGGEALFWVFMLKFAEENDFVIDTEYLLDLLMISKRRLPKLNEKYNKFLLLYAEENNGK